MCQICIGKKINHLKYLDCSGCVNLTTIPVLPKLEILKCNGCDNLKHIQVLPKLEIIRL